MSWDTYFSSTYDLKPSDAKIKKSINIFSALIDDNVLEKINPRRFIYYKRFANSLGDPEGIRKFMYTLNKIAENRDSNDKIYKKIINLTNKISRIDTDAKDYNSQKNAKLKDLSTKVYKIINDKVNNYYEDKINNNNIVKELTNVHLQNTTLGGAIPIKSNEIVDDSKDYLDNYSKKIENILENKKDSDDTKMLKYKDLLNEIDNVVNPTKTLSISKEDKILFILITFIIRIISLNIVYWSLNTNYINSFQNAFILYVVIYLIILFILTILINITYNYSNNAILYGNTGFSILANALYYFYIIPGGDLKRNARLIIHTLFMIIFMFIPQILKSSSDKDNNIDYNYMKRKKTINLLNKYTFVVWIFTSIIAINY